MADSMTATPETSTLRRGLCRDATTWYCYLLLGYFTYLVSIQGNILPFLQVELGLSYGAVSLHTSAIAVGVISVGIFSDRLIRRYGRRIMLIVGALGAAGAAGLLAGAPAAWASIGSCLLFGLFGAFIPAIVPAILSNLYGDRRDIAITESNAVAYGFAVMAPVIAGLSAALAWNWRTVPLAGAAIGVAIVAAFFSRTVPENPRAAESAATSLPPAFWAYWAMLGFTVAVEFSILLWAPAYLERIVSMSASNAALGTAAFFAAMLIGRTVGIGLVRAFDARIIFLRAALTTCVGFAAYWGSGMPAVSLMGLFAVGLGISPLFPLALSFAMGSVGAAADRASARVILAPGLAILLSPPLLGAIADNFGLGLAQLTTPVFMVLAVLAFLIGARMTKAAKASPGSPTERTYSPSVSS